MTESATTITFAFEKETKGAVRYQEIDAKGFALSIADGAKIGSLYVRKSALNGTMPMKLNVTIQAAK